MRRSSEKPVYSRSRIGFLVFGISVACVERVVATEMGAEHRAVSSLAAASCPGIPRVSLMCVGSANLKPVPTYASLSLMFNATDICMNNQTVNTLWLCPGRLCWRPRCSRPTPESWRMASREPWAGLQLSSAKDTGRLGQEESFWLSSRWMLLVCGWLSLVFLCLASAAEKCDRRVTEV